MLETEKDKQLLIFFSCGPAPKRLQLLEDSWAELFRKEILSKLLVPLFNKQCKAEHEVEVIAPIMGKAPKGFDLEGFTFDDSGHIITCPRGCSPTKTKRKKRFNAALLEKHRYRAGVETTLSEYIQP